MTRRSCGRGPAGAGGAVPVRNKRRGAITIIVLVCLVLVTAISGVLLRIGLSERRRIRADERRLQAEWLVESGLERGASRFAAAPGEYHGETWDIAAADLGGADAARVTISVESEGKTPVRRYLRVQADYPYDATERARVSKRAEVGPEPDSPGGTP